ncbi:MAG: response regulator transcription factor [Epsilonproteobacteria bacterium]|nr:response regulator transcription factor [Campylobacterota bacterium]
MSSKILFVEDDILLAESIEDLLEEEGYSVTHCVNADEALDATYSNKFDLYLLDINIPIMSGLELLQALRKANDTTPAIFLTSHKDKLKEGFLSGGDDYITKPFDNEELLLRLQALLRRTKPDEVTVGPFKLLQNNMEIYYKNTLLELSRKEFNLFSLFLLHPNSTLPKEQLIETAWGDDENASDGALRVYINRIKQIVPDITIENIRGIGYKLVL